MSKLKLLPLAIMLIVSLSCITPTVGFDNDTQTVNESAGSVTATVYMSSSESVARNFTYSIFGTATGGGTATDDFTGATTGTVTIPIGQTSATLTFPLIAHSTARADR